MRGRFDDMLNIPSGPTSLADSVDIDDHNSNMNQAFALLTHGTPIPPLIPSHTISGGLPDGLVNSIFSNLISSQTASGEQTSFATTLPVFPDELPLKFSKRMSEMLTWEG